MLGKNAPPVFAGQTLSIPGVGVWVVLLKDLSSPTGPRSGEGLLLLLTLNGLVPFQEAGC